MDAQTNLSEKMSQLVIERLADLATSEPLPTEREHLASCPMCSAELEAYQRVVLLAADERRRIAPPLTDWGSLRSQLITQGVIVLPASTTGATRARAFGIAWRSAAALIFVAGATVFGRLTAGLPIGQAMSLADVHFAAPSRDSLGDSSRVGMTGREFASTQAALTALQRAQDEYNRAARYLAANDTSAANSPQVYRDQLAVLDDMAKQSLRMVQERPQDAIMNQVYYTTLGARELTLTKLGATLSGGARLVRY